MNHYRLHLGQTGKFVLRNRDLGCAILEQNARPDRQTRRFGQMFLRRAFWRSASAKCYCAIWKVHQTRITRSQNAQQEVKKGKIQNQ